MRKFTFWVLMLLMAVAAEAQNAFINEIHYDNNGTDAGESVEVLVETATCDATCRAGLSLVRYNGSGGPVYTTPAVSSALSFTDLGNGYFIGVETYVTDGLQNGAPDGIALVSGGSTVLQFLSYEGSFTASGGAANGTTSTDIGVSESGSTTVGHSLQYTGSNGTNGTWQAAQANTFGAINAGQVFPVEFASFSGAATANAIQLAWTTASEQNADRFVIERSADNQTFMTIGEEKAAGNSSSLLSYQFTDGSPLTGSNYYRLRQVDMDGSVHFSNTIEVAFAAGNPALVLAPNPVAAGQQVTLFGGLGGETTLHLYTPAGQEVMQATFGPHVRTVSLPALPAGLYLYRLNEEGLQHSGCLQVR